MQFGQPSPVTLRYNIRPDISNVRKFDISVILNVAPLRTFGNRFIPTQAKQKNARQNKHETLKRAGRLSSSVQTICRRPENGSGVRDGVRVRLKLSSSVLTICASLPSDHS